MANKMPTGWPPAAITTTRGATTIRSVTSSSATNATRRSSIPAACGCWRWIRPEARAVAGSSPTSTTRSCRSWSRTRTVRRWPSPTTRSPTRPPGRRSPVPSSCCAPLIGCACNCSRTKLQVSSCTSPGTPTGCVATAPTCLGPTPNTWRTPPARPTRVASACCTCTPAGICSTSGGPATRTPTTGCTAAAGR